MIRRIVLLGCAGTGKTTFARLLGERTGLPVIRLDGIWQPGRHEEHLDEFRGLVADAHAGDAWISDGNFAVATFDLRLPRTELVLWLERPRLICAFNAVRRTLRKDEEHRPGKLFDVLAFIARFDRINRPRIESVLKMHAPHVPLVHLTAREAPRLLSDRARAGGLAP